MAPTVEKGPKKAKGISKKGKKGWRKNVDIEKVEEYLEDKRLEERLGGAFKDRPDEDLFTIDKGQLISKCPFGVIVWTKIPTKIFENVCPST